MEKYKYSWRCKLKQMQVYSKSKKTNYFLFLYKTAAQTLSVHSFNCCLRKICQGCWIHLWNNLIWFCQCQLSKVFLRTCYAVFLWLDSSNEWASFRCTSSLNLTERLGLKDFYWTHTVIKAKRYLIGFR